MSVSPSPKHLTGRTYESLRYFAVKLPKCARHNLHLVAGLCEEEVRQVHRPIIESKDQLAARTAPGGIALPGVFVPASLVLV